MNRSKKFIAVVLSFFIFATPSVASANAQQMDYTQVLSENSFRALEKPSEDDLKVISSYIVEHNDIFQVDPNRIDLTGALVSSDQTSFKVVAVPLQGVGNEFSNISFRIAGGEVTNILESHFLPTSESSGSVHVWEDGNSVVERHIEINEPQEGNVQPLGIWDAVSEFNSCLSAAGIPAWVVAGLSTACGLVGGLWGYAACVGAAGVASATVAFCYGQAFQKL